VRVRDRPLLLATLAGTLGANPDRVAARLDRPGSPPTAALTVAELPVDRFWQVEPRLRAIDGLVVTRRPGPGAPAGRRTAILRALTQCRVAVVAEGLLGREALAKLAEDRRQKGASEA